MPDITFILPHWIYWGGIAAVPALFMLVARKVPPRGFAAGRSLPLAFFFWLVGGFMGLHRLYLKSWGAAVFIVLFVGVIACNQEARLARNAHSIAKNEAFNASYDLERAYDDGAEEDELAPMRDELTARQEEEEAWAARMASRERWSGIIAAVILVLLLLDAALLPRTTRRAQQRGRAPPAATPPEPPARTMPPGGGGFARAVDRLNATVGEFAAYWTVIAVFVFYYEVIARYIFNSPTIWAHESMFLLFGMQYMLAGGFCLRENAHVRVDVFYLRLSPRARARADLATSAFFFIFTGALLATGWIFFHDSFSIGQVSHTEWEIPHWPIKFALPLGGAWILLQGVAGVLRDVAALRAPAAPPTTTAATAPADRNSQAAERGGDGRARGN